MKPQIEDKKLKAFLKNAKLESPAADFSARVMNRVFEEKTALEQVKKEPVLGKGFWVIFALFAGLFVAVLLIPAGGVAPENSIDLLKGVNTEAVTTGYQSFFERLGAVPLSIAGILLASSLLLFLEKFLTKSNVIS